MAWSGGDVDVVARLLADRPAFHGGGTKHWEALPGTLRFLQGRVDGDHRTLEIGCGASTVVFAARGSDHTSISPDPEEHERVRRYCARIGVDTARVTFVA